MRPSIFLIGFLAALGAPAMAAEQRSERGEEQLARALEGRVAGEPVDCIASSRIRSTRIINRTAIVYDTGRTLYVNRPNGARSLDNWDVLVTKQSTPQLCSIDVVSLYDPGSRMQSGVVFLNEFVPYEKAGKAN